MTRINTNIASLIAQNNLARSNSDLSVRLERLSTGLRINKGADDPAGLIVSERLRAEIQGLGKAISNSERASSVIATTEGYLAEVADLLNSVRGLVVEAANTGAVSQEEIEANQLQIDSAIESITRISNTASFAGLQLLNGSLEYLTSGIETSAIQGVNIFGAQFGNATSIAVGVEVIASAQTASLFLSGNTAGAAGQLLSSVTIEIVGNIGVQTISFISGTNLSAVVAGVNLVRESTGVSAALVDTADQTSGMTFTSIAYGTEQFVSVRKIGDGGDFFSTHVAQNGAETQRDEGEDVAAIINGAIATGRGLEISLNTPSLSLELLLTPAYAQTTGAARSFDITGGGATFQLGPRISSTQQVGFGVQSIASTRLGGATVDGVRYFLDSVRTGGANSLVGGRARQAGEILDAAITDISELRGRLGAFERNTIETNIRALQIGFENITASESKIRDADFAKETAELTRAQILASAGTSVLATANLTSQNVLALLG
ncbi:MAG: flagellin N-terminal helical domain-containing protein [Planctomycetota bacterium]|jgi:flagellin